MKSHPQKMQNILATAVAAVAILGTLPSLAQTPTTTQATTQPATQPSTQPATQPTTTQAASQPAESPFVLPPVMVTAQKRSEPLQQVPESIGVVSSETIKNADIREILVASKYVPNVEVSHFENRRLSFPYIRGVGAGQNSPAVTTYIDGVPQLSFASSNQEFLDVNQVQFIRGPQSTLYGRNSLGGVILVDSNKPSNKLTLDSTSNFGNFNYFDERATVNLPIIKDVLLVRMSGGYTSRDGFTKNDLTGHDVDSQQAEFGKMQIYFAPFEEFDMSLRVHGERDRDGDYPLGDLASIRQNPWHVQHAFEGNSLRDLTDTSLTMNYYTQHATFTSITGFTDWRSQDITGLDYSAADLIHRANREHENDVTQEFRAASPKDAPIELTDYARVAWVLGVFGFTQDYNQHAGNAYQPNAVTYLGVPFPFTQFNDAGLHNQGLGTFGQGTLTLWNKLDLIVGVRFDAEHSNANLNAYADSPYIPGSSENPSADFDDLSTNFGAAYHWTTDLMTYVNAAQGYKAGGFNPTSPTDKIAYNPEHDWTYEVGTKSSWFKNRLTANLDYFYVDWRQMQLNVPTDSPGTYYIDNVGKSHSQGIELELTGKPREDLELFGGLGYMQSQFDSYTQPSGLSAQGNELPFAPDVTWNVGAQYNYKLCKQATAFIRAEEIGSARYFYDASNDQSQGAYAMSNFRIGVRGRHWSLSGWVENAFEAHTVPMAFPFQLAPSGYVGESGIPRLFGVSLTLDF